MEEANRIQTPKTPLPPPVPNPAIGRGYHYENQIIGGFTWDEYLKDSTATPAPKSCFKQVDSPPSNEFHVGMKLEASDPRNLTSTCIATVVGMQGPRLRLRLDGSDNKNDFWRLVDSGDLHPIGHCEQNGGLLQPPLGYQGSVTSWPTFLLKTLAHHEYVPPENFKPEPLTPGSNEFRVGQKLEAVDRKNPHLICPATIGAVNRDQIHVTFDGWRGAFDYWCRYDSRDIFPVGWCAKAGHLLQHPGVKGSSGTPGSHHRPGRPSMKGSGGMMAGVPRDPNTSPPTQISINTNLAHLAQSQPSPSPGGSAGSTPGPHSTPSPRSRDTHSPSTTVPEPDTSTGQNFATVCVYVNSSCNCGGNLSPRKVSQLPAQFGPSSIHKVLREAVQACVDCATHEKTVLGLLKEGQGKVIITVNSSHSNKMHTKRLPHIEKVSAFWCFIEDLLDSLGCCENFFCSQPLVGGCPKCATAKITTPTIIRQAESEPITPMAATTPPASLPPTATPEMSKSDTKVEREARPDKHGSDGRSSSSSSKRRWSTESIKKKKVPTATLR